jgi:hypothetical protein
VRRLPTAKRGMALAPGGYGPGMPDIDAEAIDEEVEEAKEDQVLKREGLEEELMQEGRSDEAENIAAVETGEENL